MGFSMAQINHLAMIPELCSSEDERTSLTLIRNSTTSMANIVAYLIAFIAFSHGKNHTNLDVRGMNKSFYTVITLFCTANSTHFSIC